MHKRNLGVYTPINQIFQERVLGIPILPENSKRYGLVRLHVIWDLYIVVRQPSNFHFREVHTCICVAERSHARTIRFSISLEFSLWISEED